MLLPKKIKDFFFDRYPVKFVRVTNYRKLCNWKKNYSSEFRGTPFSFPTVVVSWGSSNCHVLVAS